MTVIDDNPKNMMSCRKSCGSCPTFIQYGLKDIPPHALFCSRGKAKTTTNIPRRVCNCFNCEVFEKNHMNFGYYCIQFSMKK